MNLKKQQVLALSLAICCSAALPMQAEAKKKDYKKTVKPTVVVSSAPQSRNQKQVLIQAASNETRKTTTPNKSGAVLTDGRQASAKTDKKAAKKASRQDNVVEKKTKNVESVNLKGKNKTDGADISKTAAPKNSGALALPVGYQDIGIFGEAVATKEQAVALLKQTNPDLKLNCSAEEIVDLYWQEAGREGVRQDLAFAQALVETGHFRFGGDVKPEQNNFCGLGTTGGGVKGANFKTPEIGVRAHIQHLLAYTAQKHPSTKIVDPRYDLAHAIRLERGLCDTWYKLNGTWAMSPNYSEKIMMVWQRMLAMETEITVTAKQEKELGKKEQDKKDDKVKKKESSATGRHKMRELVDELLKKNT